MNVKWIGGVTLGGIALIVALAMPAVSLAHTGHAHRVMGTVSSVDGNHVMVKTTDGKTVMVMLDAKTKITQGKVKADVSALKVGTRVVAEGADNKGMVTAATIQVGTAAPTTASR